MAIAQEPILQDPADVQVPEGYALEVLASGLNYVYDITFGANGEVYIAETGDQTYGTKPERAPTPRILQLVTDGGTSEAIRNVKSSNEMTEGKG